jgi:hypothetical protein
MTDAELIEAQHRVILNMGGCSCNMAWKHGKPQPKCQKCLIIEAHDAHVPSNGLCVHGTSLGYDCALCPRGIAQIWERITV